jgi:GPH family glycoside/pentoside/hexuronide:cation symporter
MLSEISAVASKKTGVQIEGIFFGIQGFFLKMAFLVSIAVLPVLLVSGSDISFVDSLTRKPEGVQKAGVYMTTIFSAVTFLVSAVFYWLFPEEIVRED